MGLTDILPRWRYLLLAALLGAVAVMLPAFASSETGPTVEAVNEPGHGLYPEAEERHIWRPAAVAVMAGGIVTFQNTSATVPHGVVWDGGPATPGCSGVPVGEAGTSWKGTCTFAQPGTYTFHCYVHPTEMTGKVEVSASGTTTTTTTTTSSPTTTTPSPPTEASLLSGPISQALKLAKSQRGGAVRGTLNVSQAAVGGRLEINLLASAASLADAKRSGRVRVGHLTRRSLAAGDMSFSVALNAKAHRALRRRHRLALTVRLVLTPTTGKALTIARSVVERP